MARSRYVITEPDKPHFLTCTVMEWLPVFTRPEAVSILLASWKYQRENEGLRSMAMLSWKIISTLSRKPKTSHWRKFNVMCRISQRARQ